MRAVLMALLLVAGGAAEAATFSYEYRGQPLFCDPAEDLCDVVSGGPVPGWAGALTVDEDLLPFGTLANASIGVTLDQDGIYTTEVRKGGATEVLTGPTLPAFLSVTGDVFAEFLAYSVNFNDYGWSFGPRRRIVSWGGSSYCGGTCDAFSGPGGDGYADGTESAGPGEWVAVAPVPLPATAPALLLALGALGLAAARRARPT